MNIQPLWDRILLQAVSENKSLTNSWIYLPESDKKEKPFIYQVIAIWPWTDKNPITVEIWDKILAGQYAGDEIKIDGEEFKMLSIDYVLAKIED